MSKTKPLPEIILSTTGYRARLVGAEHDRFTQKPTQFYVCVHFRVEGWSLDFTVPGPYRRTKRGAVNAWNKLHKHAALKKCLA